MDNRKDRPPTPREKFASLVIGIAERDLIGLFGTTEGRAAAARVGAAFRAAASSAKDPEAFWACSPSSVASCMVTAAFTRIMPGGPFPGCWLIPKRRNTAAKGEPARFVWELHYWLNHRGIKTLARRAGQAIETIPYCLGDEVVIRRGKDWQVEVNEGRCEDRDNPDNLLGVVYYVSDIESGALLAARKMSVSQILARRAKSDTVKNGEAAFGPWKDWPLEMAEKTAIKFAAGRGDVFFDDVGNMALARDGEVTSQVVDTTATVDSTTPAARQIGQDNVPPIDFVAEEARLAAAEAVAAGTNPDPTPGK